MEEVCVANDRAFGDDEETYTETSDAFTVAGAHARLQQNNEAMARLILADLPGVSLVDREREQVTWIQSNTGIVSAMSRPAPYGTSRMIGITEKYAICFEMENEKSMDDAEKTAIAERERLYYEQRMSRITTRLQATLLIKECNTRMKRVGNCALEDVISRASALRETLPMTTDIQELAEHPDAVTKANAAVANATTERPAAVRPQSLAFVLKDPTLYKEKRSKKKKPNPASVSSPQARTPMDSAKRKIRVALITSGKWPENNKYVSCWGNAKVHAQGTKMVVVDQHSDSTFFWVTRVRVFNLFDLRKPLLDHSILDPEHRLKRVIDVAVRDDDGECAVVYAQHILRIHKDSVLVIKLDRPVITCVGFRENQVMIGTTHGTVYFYNAQTGVPAGYTDLAWEMPVLGCKSQGPYLLAWDHRNVYRFHVFPDVVPPYQFYTSRPQGVSGSGSLMFLLNETGTLWITDTLTQGSTMRHIDPPPAICGRLTMDNKGNVVSIPHSKPDVEQDFFRLYEPVTYDYQAVYCDRRSVNVLYPDGTFRRIQLK